MGQGGGGNDSRNDRLVAQGRWLAANPAPTFYDKGVTTFDKSGMVAGDLFNGLRFEESALQGYRNTYAQRMAERQKYDPAARMYGGGVPFANGGNIQGFKFGSDGKLYGVVGETTKTVERQTRNGTSSSTVKTPELIEMTGVQWDTSTVPRGTPGKFYDANIIQDNDGNLLQIKDGSNVVGWARAMIQRQVDADSRLGGAAGSSRTASPGADARVATTLLGGPVGDPRKVTTKG